MTAPQMRFVDQFTGRLAGRPSKFFQALSEADEFIRQLDRGTVAQADADDAAETVGLLLEDNTGLQHRIQELEAERDAAITERDHYRAMAHQWMAQRRGRTNGGGPMSADIEAIARAWMAHQGYTDDEVNAVHNNHDAYGCEVEGMAWNCHDENGHSNHPVWDALCVACEMANVAVEALESIGYLKADEERR